MIQLLCLNYILETKDKDFITNNNLDVSFFSDYKDEFSFIKSHMNTYGVVPDTSSLLAKFNDFQVVRCTDSPEYLLNELYKDRNKRALATMFNKVASFVNADRVDEAMSYLATEYPKLSSIRGLKSINIYEDISRYHDYIERAEDYKKFYVTTGFRELDEIIGGWDRKEELATIVGRTGQGKSWILLRCALAAANAGLNVGIYSGEMSDRKVGYRIDTLMSHISNGRILHGDRSIQNDYKRFLDEAGKQLEGSIRVLTPKMIDGLATVSALGSFIDKDGLDMLCIDQHSLLDDDRHGRTVTERAANISKDLKKLQELKEIPIITVAQQNREKNDDDTLDTTQIGLTDRIGQDSTVVLMFDQKDGVLTINLTKSRDSMAKQKLKYAIDLDKGVFTYMPNEDDALGGSESDSLRDEYEYVDGDTPF